jgi:hypothetical protein
MQLNISIGYSDLFKGEKPSLSELLSELPSELIISILAKLNAEIYFNSNEQATQVKIFKMLLQQQSKEVRNEIFSNLAEKSRRNPNDPVYFFTTLANMEFIHYELLNYRDLELEDTTASQDLNFLKAYFLIAEQVNDKYVNTFDANKSDKANYFAISIWPTLFDQFEINQRSNPMIAMVKGLAFMNYFQFHSPYSAYVKRFLEVHNKATSWNYILDIAGLFKGSWDNYSSNNKNVAFSISSTEEFKAILDLYAMDIKGYREKYLGSKSNFSGIKSKPLFKNKENSYIVLDWNLLGGKLYESLIFDFYATSGINKEEKFKKLTDFKRFVGKEVTEGYVFKKLLKGIFRDPHSVLQFDETDEEGLPDCYYRKGNKVILFELKDALFSAEAINSYSYEKIREEIDRKYNTNRKGAGQLIKQLRYLSQQSFEKPQRYKYPRNLTIYPVMIYNDIFFGCPGVDDYLGQAFKTRLQESQLSKHFKSIRNLTFIPLSFLIKHVFSFREKKMDFFSLMDIYHQVLVANEKKFKRDKENLDMFFKMYDSFEIQVASRLPHIIEKDDNFLRAVIEVLDLNEGLPKP